MANQQTALEYLETALRYLSATAEQLTQDVLREVEFERALATITEK